MNRRVTIVQKGLMLLALPLLFEAAFIAVLLRHHHQHHAALRLAERTKQTLSQVDRLHRLTLELQSSLRGYILIAELSFAEEAVAQRARVAAELERLGQLISDDASQQQQLARIARRVASRLEWHDQVYELEKSGRRDEAIARIRDPRGHELMAAVHQEIETLRAAQQHIDRQRFSALERSTKFQTWLLVGGLVTTVTVGAICVVVFSRNLSRRIAVLAENANRMQRGQELVEKVAGSDELSDFDAHFHQLAAELSKSKQRERVFQQVLERRNEELVQSNRELDVKSQENEMFVYSVSHDLRSPLVNLQGFSKELELLRGDLQQLIRGDMSDAAREKARVVIERDITESVHYIQTAVNRLSTIIDALLRLSRAGRVEYRLAMVELPPIIERILAAMRGTIAARKAEVTVGELPPVFADPGAVEQVFANLIGNAVNYLDPQRKGQIEVGCKDASSDAKFRTYFVKDNGLGIADAYIPKVFAVFQRLHPNVAPGEGIGLALARRIVDRHGGKIWVESKEGEGSTFFVSLPVTAEAVSPTVAPRKESVRLVARTA